MTTKASTYGLTVNPDQHWSRAGACRQDADGWFADGKQPNWARVGQAIHICRRHCPVQKECYQAMAGLRSSVIGGYYFNDAGNLSAYQPDPGTCKTCRGAA